MNTMPPTPGRRWWSGWAKGLFWGWNVIFLAFMLFGFAPQELPALYKNVRLGTTPPIYLVFSLVLILIPVLATLVGFIFLRKRPEKLFALGYVVEWPLLLVLMIYFFAIKQGNPAITVLLVWLAVAEFIFVWYLLDEKLESRLRSWRLLALAGLTLLFAGTLYSAATLAFYVPPLAFEVTRMLSFAVTNTANMLRDLRWVRWNEVFLAILGQGLSVFSVILLLMMPIAAPILAGRAWWRSYSRSRRQNGFPVTLLSSVLPVALVAAILFASMQQPQHTAFALLKNPPATPQQAEALLQRQEQIRAGLLNAYLASFRYISSEGEVRHISDLYRYTFQTSVETSWKIEQIYEVFLQPFLYSPVHPVPPPTTQDEQPRTDNQALSNEQTEAATLYKRFFDQPINQGERQEIVNAVRANSNGTQAELAWQAVDDRSVHLERQEVTLSEHGDWAEVQLHEVYQNRTFQRKEVVYYFSLPESAVITGLWLGTNPDRSKAFPFQVAPRGAAQAVYRNEIRYQRDPALLAQIGPRQYRLRAFPVEPQLWQSDTQEYSSGPALHLWMTYRTVSVEGKWPLPILAEKSNVFWDQSTTRLINGKSFPNADTTWLPDFVAPSLPVTRTVHRVDFPNGLSVLVQPAPESSVELPADLHIAVVADRSFSMRKRATEMNQALARLTQLAQGRAEPEVFLTASEIRGEAPGKVGLANLSPEAIRYFGGQNSAELLGQFETLSAGEAFDLILVLTDGSGYELGASSLKISVPDAPVWLVHLGSEFPLGYDDPTLEAIQASGGGAAASLDDALARFALARKNPGRLDQLDGYTWQVIPISEADAQGGEQAASLTNAAEEDGFDALAARRVVLAEMARNHAHLDQVAVLDQIHGLAVKQGIVTPFSSMIVLVNTSQQQLLDTLNQRIDRFQRETENVGQTSNANPFAVTGVPEPEEWLLIILASGALAWLVWKKMTPQTAVL